MGLFTNPTLITYRIAALSNMAGITDWDLMQTLCRIVNSTEDGPEEAARELRKNLRSGSPQVQLNSVTIIQVLVNGCGSKFQALLATIKFTGVIDIVLCSSETSPYVKIHLMKHLERWSTTFARDPGLALIPRLYKRMNEMGILEKIDPGLRQRAAEAQAQSQTQTQARVQTQAQAQAQRIPYIFKNIELANNNAHMLLEAISFADPEVEAVEENELIKEFYFKCVTLQRAIHSHLSEVSGSATPNEHCLGELLACNQELLRALTAHNQMLERCQATNPVNVQHAATVTGSPIQTFADFHPNATTLLDTSGNSSAEDLIDVRSATEVDPGCATAESNTMNGKRKSVSVALQASPEAHATADPFADHLYRVIEHDDIAAIIKNGKRADTIKVEVPLVEEQELVLLVQRQSLMSLGQNGSSSSSAAATSSTMAVHPVAALPVSPVV